MFNPPGPPKSLELLESYKENGSGTVQGTVDRDKQAQIERLGKYEAVFRENDIDETVLPNLTAEDPEGAWRCLAGAPPQAPGCHRCSAHRRGRYVVPADEQASSHTIFICCLSSLAKMFFGISAWTPRTMSTTWVTRKLTAMLHRA